MPSVSSCYKSPRRCRSTRRPSFFSQDDDEDLGTPARDAKIVIVRLPTTCNPLEHHVTGSITFGPPLELRHTFYRETWTFSPKPNATATPACTHHTHTHTHARAMTRSFSRELSPCGAHRASHAPESYRESASGRDDAQWKQVVVAKDSDRILDLVAIEAM